MRMIFLMKLKAEGQLNFRRHMDGTDEHIRSHRERSPEVHEIDEERLSNA